MKSELKAYFDKLGDYLYLNGIDIKLGLNTRCPIINHKSGAPFVMNMGQDGDLVWHCFACEEGGTIFELASAIHGFPRSNEAGFYTVTVQHLSDVLGIPMPPRKNTMTSAERFKYKLYSATREIANTLSLNSSEIKTYCNQRKWNESVLKKFNIGGIPNYKTLRTQLEERYDDTVLKALGFITANDKYPSFFAENRLFFTIHDFNGRPVGFTARLLDYKPGGIRKYVNSKSSAIFKKSDILYNLHRALRSKEKNQDKILYIVEGQADVITLFSHGLESVVALSGTSFTDEHIELIKDFDMVVSCMDADQGGSKATKKLYNKYMAALNKPLYLVPLKDGYDPDQYVNDYNLEKFLELPALLPEEWEIYTEQILKGKILVDYWMPRLLTLNSLYHTRALKILANKSKIPEKDLKTRLNLILIDEISQILAEAIVEKKVNLNIERI
tara:strand:+ start:2533 stop:3861 length:1329 start_codon:yes stop_codon:yes gene_type:complete